MFTPNSPTNSDSGVGRMTLNVIPASGRLDVRRLAALDMHGARGTLLRRRVILAEFLFGMVGGAAMGVWALTWGGVVSVVLGIWLLGLAANYLVLTAHVLALWQPGKLEQELTGIDLGAELRYYTRVQGWVLVPFWVAVLAVLQARQVNPADDRER